MNSGAREAVAVGMPDRVGRYELLLPVGTGGMGTVYLARCEVMNGVFRDVAVKLMHPQLRAEPELPEELLREARLAASVRHPNVVSVIEAGHGSEGVYLAMDYVEGDTLAGLLRASIRDEQPLPLPIVARVLHDALSGLHAVHEIRDTAGRPLGIIHRDFSPQNILVGTDGISRLTDFGIAKALHELGATATGTIKGKASYMAPEQALGKPVDRRCDVWAAGVVAWEALAGKRLFAGKTDAESLLRIVSRETPPRVSSVRAEVPAEVDDAIGATLLSDPEARLGTARELRDRLHAAWASQDGVADHEMVARFVRERNGAKLARLRERANQVLSARAATTSTVKAVTTTDLRSGETPSAKRLGALPFDDLSSRAGALSTDTGPVARSARRWRIALAGGAAMAAVLAAAMLLRPPVAGDDGTAAVRAEAPEARATALPIEPSAIAPTPSPPSTSDPVTPVAARLRIVSDAPIAQLRIGARSLVLAEAAREIDVELVPDERAATLELRATARDGRRTKQLVRPDENLVNLRFGSEVAAPPRRPAPKRRTEATDGPGLAESPYAP